MSLVRPLARPLVRALPHSLIKGVGVPAIAIRQRDSAVIRDRAGNTIQVRS